MQMSWIPKNVNVNAAFSNANAIEPKADLYSNNCDVWCEETDRLAEDELLLNVEVLCPWSGLFDLNHLI